MGRPRSYERHAVISAAKDAFWQGGFLGTGIDELEQATGLSRSSLYLAFGSKQGLFLAALADDETGFIGPMLAQVEAPGAGLREVAGFFTRLAGRFRDPSSQRGCLAVNSMTELPGRRPEFAETVPRLDARYRAAFSNALDGAATRGEMERRLVERRVRLLASSALGAWVTVRTDHAAAAADCRAIAREVTSWRAGGHGTDG